ncbi:hypothetical protein [Novosphingobium sp. MBES04]|uniref:hypothetical protein n=1 Tax=Novosphingobium sp. MBES04 TaxID=1206458 RepID=UPI001185F527|nr:hypothetical protein [Novosphingobium sp. MBES04]
MAGYWTSLERMLAGREGEVVPRRRARYEPESYDAQTLAVSLDEPSEPEAPATSTPASPIIPAEDPPRHEEPTSSSPSPAVSRPPASPRTAPGFPLDDTRATLTASAPAPPVRSPRGHAPSSPAPAHVPQSARRAAAPPAASAPAEPPQRRRDETAQLSSAQTAPIASPSSPPDPELAEDHAPPRRFGEEIDELRLELARHVEARPAPAPDSPKPASASTAEGSSTAEHPRPLVIEIGEIAISLNRPAPPAPPTPAAAASPSPVLALDAYLARLGGDRS